MSRLCVAGSGSLTIGRRVGLTTAAVGLGLVILPGPALAAGPDPIGYSPAKDVVAVAPQAVSITFGQPLRSSGASLRVIAATGEDVGKGQIGTAHRTLRRALQLGAPGGDYTIRWTAISAGGHKMSGAFSFTAARGNLAGQSTAGAPGGPGAPGASGQAAPSAVTSSSSGATVPTPAGSPAGALITASRPTWVAQAGSSHPGSSSTPDKHRLPKGFTAIPLAVAALLVLSAALVTRLKRRIHAS